MFNILKNLIAKKFYATKEDIQSKVDICFAMSRITQEQYTDLTMLIEEVYGEVPPNSEVE